MPPFNPTGVKANTNVVFPKDDYEFSIGEPKSFTRVAGQGTDNEHESYGVRFQLTVKDGEYDGKKTIHTIYHHSEAAGGMAKQFLMAALGYKKNEEARFDEENADKDWSCDYATGAVGDAYREMTGRHVMGSLDVKKGQNGEEQQNFKTWRPV